MIESSRGSGCVGVTKLIIHGTYCGRAWSYHRCYTCDASRVDSFSRWLYKVGAVVNLTVQKRNLGEHLPEKPQLVMTGAAVSILFSLISKLSIYDLTQNLHSYR